VTVLDYSHKSLEDVINPWAARGLPLCFVRPAYFFSAPSLKNENEAYEITMLSVFRALITFEPIGRFK
jgi:hypothetical protein